MLAPQPFHIVKREGEYFMKKLFQAAAVALMLVPSVGLAQAPDLRPISEYLQLPEERRDAAYPFLRCIGLFQGLFRYGSANFTEEQALRTQISNEAMGLVAFTLRQDRHPDFSVDVLASQIGTEVEDLTTVYFERMSKNYSLTGEAYGSDQTVSDDFETCGQIAQYSVDAFFGN